MPNNKHITDDEFITGLGELVRLRAAQQPETVKEIAKKYPRRTEKKAAAETTAEIIDILEALGIVAPDPEGKGGGCND